MRIFPRQVIFKNVFAAVGTIFLLAGSVFSGIGTAMTVNDQYFRKNGIPAEATIEKIHGEDVMIWYEADGAAFAGPLGYYSSSMREGDTVPIYYDASNPARIHAASSSVLSIVFLSTGLLLLVCGGSLVAYTLLKGRRNRWLLENGMRLQAKVIGVDINRAVSSNYRHPYRVIGQYQMPDGSTREFYSEDIWYDPTDALVSDTVTVCLDPEDNSKYYMDLSTVLPDEDGGIDGIGEDL